MKTPVARSAKRILRRALSAPLARFIAGRGTILMYHRIVPQDEYQLTDFEPNLELIVSEAAFDAQIRYLAENYHCTHLDAVVAGLASDSLVDRTIAITFDDGYRDNLTLALPILKKYNVPATIYVASGIINRTCRLWWYEHELILKSLERLDFEWKGKAFRWDLSTAAKKYEACAELNRLFKGLSPQDQESVMAILTAKCPRDLHPAFQILSWDEVRRLDGEQLITIGGHSDEHSVLKALTPAELKEEVEGSKRLLEKELGHAVDHFAYPFGGAAQADQREFEAAKAAGYISGVTTRIGHLDRHATPEFLYSLPRVAVSYRDDLENIRWKLSGLYSLLRRNRQRSPY